MHDDEETKLKKELDSSIHKLEALLNDPENRGPGERLDTSRLKKVAADMEVKARELRSSGEEMARRIEDARERATRTDRRWVKIRLWVYVSALVFMVVYFVVFGR